MGGIGKWRMENEKWELENGKSKLEWKGQDLHTL
jgi:hypothetical protein